MKGSPEEAARERSVRGPLPGGSWISCLWARKLQETHKGQITAQRSDKLGRNVWKELRPRSSAPFVQLKTTYCPSLAVLL